MESYNARIQHFEDCLSLATESIRLTEFKQLCFAGIPDKPGLRQMSWKILLGYLSADKTRWEADLLSQRGAYYVKDRSEFRNFVKDLIVDPGEDFDGRMDQDQAGSGLDIDDHPLSPSSSSRWATFFADNQMLEQIDKDVRRTLPDFSFFQLPIPYSHLCPLSIDPQYRKKKQTRTNRDLFEPSSAKEKKENVPTPVINRLRSSSSVSAFSTDRGIVSGMVGVADGPPGTPIARRQTATLLSPAIGHRSRMEQLQQETSGSEASNNSNNDFTENPRPTLSAMQASKRPPGLASPVFSGSMPSTLSTSAPNRSFVATCSQQTTSNLTSADAVLETGAKVNAATTEIKDALPARVGKTSFHTPTSSSAGLTQQDDAPDYLFSPIPTRRSLFKRVAHLNQDFGSREHQSNLGAMPVRTASALSGSSSGSIQKSGINNGDDDGGIKVDEEEDLPQDLHWEAIERILFTYAKLNPGVGYVQGMNEILGPLYYLLANDSNEESRAHAEADSFWLFHILMAHFRDQFVRSLDRDRVSGIGSMIARMSRRLKIYDFELWKNLEDKDIAPEYYSFRWLTVLCAQEFEVPDVWRLWDSVFADTGGLERDYDFLLDFCCSMICHLKSELLQGDFADNVKLLQNYPSVDIQPILITASHIRDERRRQGGFLPVDSSSNSIDTINGNVKDNLYTRRLSKSANTSLSTDPNSKTEKRKSISLRLWGSISSLTENLGGGNVNQDFGGFGNPLSPNQQMGGLIAEGVVRSDRLDHNLDGMDHRGPLLLAALSSPASTSLSPSSSSFMHSASAPVSPLASVDEKSFLKLPFNGLTIKTAGGSQSPRQPKQQSQQQHQQQRSLGEDLNTSRRGSSSNIFGNNIQRRTSSGGHLSPTMTSFKISLSPKSPQWLRDAATAASGGGRAGGSSSLSSAGATLNVNPSTATTPTGTGSKPGSATWSDTFSNLRAKLSGSNTGTGIGSGSLWSATKADSSGPLSPAALTGPTSPLMSGMNKI